MKTLLQLALISAQTDTDPGPDWRTQAACLGRDPELFFPHPSDREGEDAAVAVCWGCPVEADCLAHALRLEKRSQRVQPLGHLGWLLGPRTGTHGPTHTPNPER